MTIFIDNCVSKQLARWLKEAGEDVLHLQEEFAAGTLDEDWIPTVCGNGWPIITSDKMMASTPHLRKALHENHAIAAFLPKAYTQWKLIRQAAFLFRVWEDLRAELHGSKPGFLWLIREHGKLERYTKSL